MAFPKQTILSSATDLHYPAQNKTGLRVVGLGAVQKGKLGVVVYGDAFGLFGFCPAVRVDAAPAAVPPQCGASVLLSVYGEHIANGVILAVDSRELHGVPAHHRRRGGTQVAVDAIVGIHAQQTRRHYQRAEHKDPYIH